MLLGGNKVNRDSHLLSRTQRSIQRQSFLYGSIGLVCVCVGTFGGDSSIWEFQLSSDIDGFFNLSVMLGIASLGGILLGIAGRMSAKLPSVGGNGGSKGIAVFSTVLIVLSSFLGACATCGLLVGILW